MKAWLTGLNIPMQTAIQRYGRDLARQLFQCSLDSIDTVEKIVIKNNIEYGFARTGHLLVANKPKHYKALAEEVKFMMKEFDNEVYLLSCQEQYQEIGSDLYYGALLDKFNAGVNPAKYVVGLANAVENEGPSIHEWTRVRTFEQREMLYFVQTERGTLSTKKCIRGNKWLY